MNKFVSLKIFCVQFLKATIEQLRVEVEENYTCFIASKRPSLINDISNHHT